MQTPVHESLKSLEAAAIASAHEDCLDRTDALIRALADERIATQREWQAYLRRIQRQ